MQDGSNRKPSVQFRDNKVNPTRASLASSSQSLSRSVSQQLIDQKRQSYMDSMGSVHSFQFSPTRRMLREKPSMMMSSKQSWATFRSGNDLSRRYTGKLTDDPKNKTRFAALWLLWDDFVALLRSPLFFRHRNPIYLLIEVAIPAIIAMIIFSVFTAGVSWKQAKYYKQAANARVITFLDNTMGDATSNFRTLHTNERNQVLIYYSPVTEFTATIMQGALEQAGVSESNFVIKHGGDGNTGAVGVLDVAEMYERALWHRNERTNHGMPIAVLFQYDPKQVSNLTNVPYNITYTISNFDEAISKTEELHPFVPPAISENWRSPYLTSGFIGLQYAIDESIIRLILGKQRAIEMKEFLQGSKIHATNSRSLSTEHDSDKMLSSDDIDPDLLKFLIAETLEDIREEKERREELDEIGEPYNPRIVPDGKGIGRSLGLDDETPRHQFRSFGTAGELPRRTLRAFNYDHTGTPEFRYILTYVVTFTFVVSYSFVSFFTVVDIARDNLTGTKELLQIHGLPHYMYWTMLLLHALVFRAITSALVLLTLKIDYGNGKIADVSNADVLFLLIYLHQLALTFMNFFIAGYITSMRNCGVVAVSICLLSFYLPESFYGMGLIGGFSDFIVGLIFPNWCFRQAMRCLLDHETNQKSVSWSRLFETEYVYNEMSVGEGMLKLFFVSIFYYLLSVYKGISSPALLFPMSEKWRGIREWLKKRRESRIKLRKEQSLQNDDSDDNEDFPKPPVYETTSPDQECHVHIRNLSKHYGKHKVALDSVSIDIMHGEITVFLGHSGCGKSTLISILAGMLQPSSGRASVNGFDVSTNPISTRKFMGICPQKLVAFNLLTVREHLHLCHRLHGYTNVECENRTAAILTQLKLWNLRSTLPTKMTNDELRRLGIAMSLVESPTILLLDEPTRGIDAMGRREVWDIILSMRHQHTIIVTSNYMDEAEHLSDKLVLLAHGRLVCYGSLDFLKSQYDTGYFLKLIPFRSTFVDANAVVNFVRSYLGSKVQIKRHKRLKDVDTLELELPTKEKVHFANFCDELDKRKDALHIMRYSIRQVTLNDIFIKICSSVAADGYAADLYVRRDSAGDIKTVLKSEVPEIPEGAEKHVSRIHHLKTLLHRATTVFHTSKRTVILHLVLPLVIIWIVVFQAKLFVQSSGENPEMTLSPTRFGSNLRILSQFTEDDPIVNYSSHMSRVLSPYQENVDQDSRLISKLYQGLNTEQGKVGYVKNEHMFAFEFGRAGGSYLLRGYFASGNLHSAPVALNVMNNVLLSAISESERNFTENWHPYTITVKNDPMPQVVDGQFERGCGLPCVLLAILMSFAVALIAHASCVLPSAEKENGIKHLMFMCGVEPSIYWFSHYMVDLFVSFLMTAIIVLIFLSDLHQTFVAAELIGAVWLICALYLLWSGLTFSYYVSCRVPERYRTYNVLAMLHLFLGILLFLWLTLVRPDSGFGIFMRNFILFFVPPFTITSAFFHYFSNSGQRNVCRNINSFIQSICDDSKTATHAHSQFYSGHATGQENMNEDLLNLDPKLARCCAIICKGTPKDDFCFHPPLVFNSSAETYENPGLITDVCALFFQGFIYWIFLILADRQVFDRLIQRLVIKYLHQDESNQLGRSKTEDDSSKNRNVELERLAVNSILQENDWPDDVAIVCQGLTKSSTTTMVMKDFNLLVKKGQCVAILGRGNSAKSCIARMIAGNLVPTKGNCYVKNCDLVSNRRDYLTKIGYCPQRCSTFQELTGTQMLELMGRLRGIHSDILGTHVNKWLSVMGLAEVANDRCKEYGDGVKQRLCTAMALIGEPEIILLDEPTSGIDPSSRERLWCVIEHLTQRGFTIIFTTYSTDEAFSLADKVVILSEGVVQCIGHPDEVQNMYAQGHTITFKLKHEVLSSYEMMAVADDRVNEFKDHVVQLYKYVDLLDEHDELLIFFLRDVRLSWAEVFRRGHYLATAHDDIISTYEVTEGGIDDIFVFLGNKYHELSKPHVSDSKVQRRRGSLDSETAEELSEIKKLQNSLKRNRILK